MSNLERWLPFKFPRPHLTENKHLTKAAPSEPFAMMPWGAHPMRQFVQSFFNDPFFADPFAQLEQMDRWFGDYGPRRFTPKLEVSDEGKALKITAELPGMSKDDVTLQLDSGMLTISGEKKHQEETKSEGVYRTERYYGSFQRSVPLPEDLDQENADAEFKNGVLTIHIPKLETAKETGRRIEVKG
jgi:HSP20 family protein